MMPMTDDERYEYGYMDCDEERRYLRNKSIEQAGYALASLSGGPAIAHTPGHRTPLFAANIRNL